VCCCFTLYLDPRNAPSAAPCDWLRSLAAMQLQAYHESNPQHAAALTALLALRSAPPSSSSSSSQHTPSPPSLPPVSTVVFLASITDPAVDPTLSDVTIRRCPHTHIRPTQDTCHDYDQHQHQHLAVSEGDSEGECESGEADQWERVSGNSREETETEAPAVDAQSLNVMNKTLLEAIFPALPGLLPALSLPDLVVTALLCAQWCSRLMTDSYWRLGWGSRVSSKRNLLETLQTTVLVLTARLGNRGGHASSLLPTQAEDDILCFVCFADSLAVMLTCLAKSFVACSMLEQHQMGRAAKLDLKTAQMTLDVCLNVMKLLKQQQQQQQEGQQRQGESLSGGEGGGGWVGDVKRLCAHIASNLPAPPVLPPGAKPVVHSAGADGTMSGGTCGEGGGSGNNNNNSGGGGGDVSDVVESGEKEEEEEEFSDWDDSESDSDSDSTDEVQAEESNNNFHCSGGGGSGGHGGSFYHHHHSSGAVGNMMSGSNWDVTLVHNCMQEMHALLSGIDS
jgi:hypothetical protein